MSKPVSSATELKLADVLAEREAWDASSAVAVDNLWTLVQPRLPRGDAARAYADDSRFRERAGDMTQAERVNGGQRMFFDDALVAMVKQAQVIQQGGQVWIGTEPLWYRAGTSREIYIPGTNGVRDIEAQQRIDDRKAYKRVLDRKSFQIDPDSAGYKLVRWSIDQYGYRPEYPIFVDADDPGFVLIGRTRLAVARELDAEQPGRGLEDAVWRNAVSMKATATDALRELFRSDVFRRHLSATEVKQARELLGESDAGLAEVQQAEEVLKSHEDRVQRTREEKQARVREALLEDASRSNREIAEAVGVAHTFVAEVRGKLESNSSIHCMKFAGGRGSRSGEHSPACWCREDEPGVGAEQQQQEAEARAKAAAKAEQKRREAEARAEQKRRDAEELIQRCLVGLRKGLNRTQVGAEVGLSHDSLPLATAWGAALERLALETEQESEIEQESETEQEYAAEQESEPVCMHCCPVHCP